MINGFGNINSQELKNIQKNLFELLKEFDGICRKHNITYYLDGGSVIGALRHKDFIPWDDDIDVLIKAEDFKKLSKVLKDDGLLENRVFAAIGEDYSFHRPFARYINTEVLHLMSGSIIEANYLPGVYIDIFILDGISSDYVDHYIDIIERSEEWFHNRFNGVVGRASVFEYIGAVLYERMCGEEKVANYYINQIEKLKKKSKNIDVYIPRQGFNYAVYDSDVFQEPQYVEFRGELFPVPTKPEKFLRGHYSVDWFNIPAPESRFSHHHTLTSEFITPVDLKKKIDWVKNNKKVHAVQEKRHLFQILRKKYIVKNQINFCKRHEIKFRFELDKYFENTVGVEFLKNMNNQGSFSEINKISEPYWAAQKELKGLYPLADRIIKIKEDILFYIFKAKIMAGDIFAVQKYMKHYDKFSTELLNHQKEMVEIFAALEAAIQDKDFLTAEECLNEISDEYQLASDVVKYKSLLGILKFGSIEEQAQFYQKIEDKNGVFLDFHKIIADKYFERGDFITAQEIYSHIAENHNNGIALLDSAEKLRKIGESIHG